MVKVVKLHESTLRKRLNEFGATTTALLTLGKIKLDSFLLSSCLCGLFSMCKLSIQIQSINIKEKIIIAELIEIGNFL